MRYLRQLCTNFSFIVSGGNDGESRLRIDLKFTASTISITIISRLIFFTNELHVILRFMPLGVVKYYASIERSTVTKCPNEVRLCFRYINHEILSTAH